MARTGIEQGRASFAFKEVSDYVKKAGVEEQKNYKSYLKRLPALIQTNGLGQALVFYYSEKGVYYDIYQQISKWIKTKYPEMMPDDDLIKTVVNIDNAEYRLLTVEVVALINWMRRFANGMIKK